MAGAAQEKAESSRTPCWAPALVPSTPRSLKLPQNTEQHPWETHPLERGQLRASGEGGGHCWCIPPLGSLLPQPQGTRGSQGTALLLC